ncbi:MAG: lipoyl synthase [Gammaproteobacteria bacterium]|nr:lipoyl synthase [Gammaproteobacteria bacterium]
MPTNNRKPPCIRSQWPCNPEISAIKKLLRQNKLTSVCEAAACPNLGECFKLGTATFMIMGDICTRNCRFCNVTPGKRPSPIDQLEPNNLAQTVEKMGLKYVVITSVTRDDLPDGGASHFTSCIKEIRNKNSQIKIEILTPDFRHSIDKSLKILGTQLPDVFNHNVETAPRLYPIVRPEAEYLASLELLRKHKELYPEIPTKSGLMLGLGETKDEIYETMSNLRAHEVDRLTIGQYLQPTKKHLEVTRYVTPPEFTELGKLAYQLGFKHVTSSPLARSSYHAAETST